MIKVGAVEVRGRARTVMISATEWPSTICRTSHPYAAHMAARSHPPSTSAVGRQSCFPFRSMMQTRLSSPSAAAWRLTSATFPSCSSPSPRKTHVVAPMARARSAIAAPTPYESSIPSEPDGVGAAIALRARAIGATTWVFLGDGEEQEGNVAEASRHAAALGLDSLVCIIDRNGKQLCRPTAEVDGGCDLAAMWAAYGWDVRHIVDGHSVAEIMTVLARPRTSTAPTLIIADTVKGYGLEGCTDVPSGYHTLSTCPRGVVSDAVQRLTADLEQRGAPPSELKRIGRSLLATVPRPAGVPTEGQARVLSSTPLDPVRSFDDALEAYLRNLVTAFRSAPGERLYVMTADWIPSALVRSCGLDEPHVRFIDVGIREQHLLASAHGIASTDPRARVLVIIGDGFVLRAADQVHAIAQAGSQLVVIGTDAGICEARNGSTHMSTGQPGALTAMPGMEFLEPADTQELHDCIDWALFEAKGPVYVRLHSAEAAALPPALRNMSAYVAFEPVSSPRVVLVGSGLIVAELIVLARDLDLRGTGARVVNVVAQKRLTSAFAEFVVEGAPLFIAYNGNADVLASAVARAILS